MSRQIFIRCCSATRPRLENILNLGGSGSTIYTSRFSARHVRLLSVSAVRLSEDLVISSESCGAAGAGLGDLTVTETGAGAESVTEPTSLATTDIFYDSSALSSAAEVQWGLAGEPSLTSLGLAHSWPSGWLQSGLEILHIDFGLTWWQAIVVTTIAMRTVVFPIMLMAQRNLARYNNHLPTIQKLQCQAQLAGARGAADDAKFANSAWQNYMMANNCHPAYASVPMLFQAICFSSMFFGLRGMANAPVESLRTGGLAWFPDLIASDPLFALPLIAASTLGLMIYLGADGMNTAAMPAWLVKVSNFLLTTQAEYGQ